jgi:hypothetical protein
MDMVNLNGGINAGADLTVCEKKGMTTLHSAKRLSPVETAEPEIQFPVRKYARQ